MNERFSALCQINKFFGIDVAAGEHEADLFAGLDLEAAADESRNADRRRRLDNDLCLVDDVIKCLGNCVFGHGNYLVNIFFDERIGVGAGSGYHEAVGQSVLKLDGYGLALLPAFGIARDTLGFCADNTALWIYGLDSRCNAGKNAAAAMDAYMQGKN